MTANRTGPAKTIIRSTLRVYFNSRRGNGQLSQLSRLASRQGFADNVQSLEKSQHLRTERLVLHNLQSPATGTDGEIRLTYRELTALIEDAVRQLK